MPLHRTQLRTSAGVLIQTLVQTVAQKTVMKIVMIMLEADQLISIVSVFESAGQT
jgi:hypothetical protein